jgi:hypothetical protein
VQVRICGLRLASSNHRRMLTSLRPFVEKVNNAMATTTLRPAGAALPPTAIDPKRSVGGSKATREVAARRAFDGYFLQAALEQALPKKSSAVFGRRFSGDVMRSMLAERVAAEIAKRSDFAITGKALDGFNPHRKQAVPATDIPLASDPAVAASAGGDVE